MPFELGIVGVILGLLIGFGVLGFLAKGLIGMIVGIVATVFVIGLLLTAFNFPAVGNWLEGVPLLSGLAIGVLGGAAVKGLVFGR